MNPPHPTVPQNYGGPVVWLLGLHLLTQLRPEVQRGLANLWHWWEHRLLWYESAYRASVL